MAPHLTWMNGLSLQAGQRLHVPPAPLSQPVLGWRRVGCQVARLSPTRLPYQPSPPATSRMAARAAQAEQGVLVLQPQESALVEQLRALLEMSATYDSAKAPPASVASQLGLHVVSSSHQAVTPNNLVTDTLAEEAEEGGGDGMASALTPHPAPRPVATTPRPPSVLSALRDVNTAAQLGGSSSVSSGSRGGFGSMAGKLASQWGQSALQQLQARKAFASMQDLGSGSNSTASGAAVGPSAWRQHQEPPHFDPMDTLDDEEEGFGIEAALPRMPSSFPQGLPKITLRSTASKIASKVGGFSKAAAKKVAASVAEPFAQSVALTSDAAALVMGSATRAGEAVAAAAAASIPSPVLQAADTLMAAAKSAPSKLRDSLSGGNRSSWLAVDARESSNGASSGHPVRIIVVTASPELTRTISQLHTHQSTSGLVSFESYKLGVKVPQAVYDEASALYNGQILPLIMDYLSEHPQGKVCFTGSGAGGSLATVLGLMAASRGLRPYCARPLVCAFDAPPVLAEVMDGALWGCGTTQQDACQLTDWQEMVADVEARGLLAELGLPKDAVLNISTQPHTPSSTAQPATPSAPSAAAVAAGHAAASASSAASSAMAAASSGAAAAKAASAAAARSIAQAAAAAARHLSLFSHLAHPSGRTTATLTSSMAAVPTSSSTTANGDVSLKKLVGELPVAQTGSSASRQPVVMSTMEGDDHMGADMDRAAAQAAADAAGVPSLGSRFSQKPKAAAKRSDASTAADAAAASPQLQLFKLVGQVRFQH